MYITGDRKETTFSLTRNKKMFEEVIRRVRVVNNLLKEQKAPILEPSIECSECQYYERCFIKKKNSKHVDIGEMLGMGKTISNPKIFTLDNQSASVTQGEEIPYQTTSEGTTTTSFKEAALKLEVTPSIIGDGNVLLSIKVNNDTPNRAAESDEPPINKMEIVTTLLVADGDIVVIGGIKKNVIATSKGQTPGLGNMPVIGNLFKGTSKSDNLDELLVFIAPRIL